MKVGMYTTSINRTTTSTDCGYLEELCETCAIHLFAKALEKHRKSHKECGIANLILLFAASCLLCVQKKIKKRKEKIFCVSDFNLIFLLPFFQNYLLQIFSRDAIIEFAQINQLKCELCQIVCVMKDLSACNGGFLSLFFSSFVVILFKKAWGSFDFFELILVINWKMKKEEKNSIFLQFFFVWRKFYKRNFSLTWNFFLRRLLMKVSDGLWWSMKKCI